MAPPLRFESSREHWWFLTPIDWAAANGHTEVVKELLRMDASLLEKLTSKRRIRRLEMLWDDQYAFSDAARGRAKIAKDLLQECGGQNRPDNLLIEAGYGVWVLYTAAAAGDEEMVHGLLSTRPDLISGDTEFGLSDLLYAAAKGTNWKVFHLILSVAKLSRANTPNYWKISSEFGIGKLDSVGGHLIQSKAVLAAAKAGNVEMVKELLKDNSAPVLSFTDSRGTSALHAAAGRGHVEVVKKILELCPASITARDVQDNTALHTAARRGCLETVIEMIRFNKEVLYMRNKSGETPLHVAVMGTFITSPGRKQGGRLEVVGELLCSSSAMTDYVNWKNKDGRNALHLAVSAAQLDEKLVRVLLQVPQILVNDRDYGNQTALDIAKSRAASGGNPSEECQLNVAISLIMAFGGQESPNLNERNLDPSRCAEEMEPPDEEFSFKCCVSTSVTASGPEIPVHRHGSLDEPISTVLVQEKTDQGHRSSAELATNQEQRFSTDGTSPSGRFSLSTETPNAAPQANREDATAMPAKRSGSSRILALVNWFQNSKNNGRTSRKRVFQSKPAELWAQALQSKRWKNFRSEETETPTPLRQRFKGPHEAPDNSSVASRSARDLGPKVSSPTSTEIFQTHNAGPSPSMSPFPSPLGGPVSPISSPSSFTTRLKAYLVNNGSVNKQSSCDGTEVAEDHLAALEAAFCKGRQSVGDFNQCFCIDVRGMLGTRRKQQAMTELSTSKAHAGELVDASVRSSTSAKASDHPVISVRSSSVRSSTSTPAGDLQRQTSTRSSRIVYYVRCGEANDPLNKPGLPPVYRAT